MVSSLVNNHGYTFEDAWNVSPCEVMMLRDFQHQVAVIGKMGGITPDDARDVLEEAKRKGIVKDG